MNEGGDCDDDDGEDNDDVDVDVLQEHKIEKGIFNDNDDGPG